eukprot:CAMPEP_0174265890 /NCGR_PEP_ID=MMETSP0439-20130205/28352_1 /TAXON_ID=0 /ORGANISM="Stereomyxa ramosa, Strain Chinc5" /LENGTH=118 /DNA_ID=CAMNT_0015352577 /DNA_START=8 /DNA_END=360 /DNA_ORIENTATION=-
MATLEKEVAPFKKIVMDDEFGKREIGPKVLFYVHCPDPPNVEYVSIRRENDPMWHLDGDGMASYPGGPLHTLPLPVGLVEEQAACFNWSGTSDAAKAALRAAGFTEVLDEEAFLDEFP